MDGNMYLGANIGPLFTLTIFSVNDIGNIRWANEYLTLSSSLFKLKVTPDASQLWFIQGEKLIVMDPADGIII
jgi:hypothetical protein